MITIIKFYSPECATKNAATLTYIIRNYLHIWQSRQKASTISLIRLWVWNQSRLCSDLFTATLMPSLECYYKC